jgi:glycosyltransferase involved in cell wall biosynthesis
MIPTYNQAKYISKAIESALNIDYPNIEVIVSDDCSTDNTEEVVSKYLSDDRFKYIKNEKNLGRVVTIYPFCA